MTNPTISTTETLVCLTCGATLTLKGDVFGHFGTVYRNGWAASPIDGSGPHCAACLDALYRELERQRHPLTTDPDTGHLLLAPTPRPAAPKRQLTPEQQNLTNHWRTFGANALTRKVKGGWVLELGKSSPPVVYKTKHEAADMVTRIVLAFGGPY